jgi:hypothetical protein
LIGFVFGLKMSHSVWVCINVSGIEQSYTDATAIGFEIRDWRFAKLNGNKGVGMAGSMVGAFFDGLSGGSFFTRAKLPGAPTQVFADAKAGFPYQGLVDALVTKQKAEDLVRQQVAEPEQPTEMAEPASASVLDDTFFHGGPVNTYSGPRGFVAARSGRDYHVVAKDKPNFDATPYRRPPSSAARSTEGHGTFQSRKLKSKKKPVAEPVLHNDPHPHGGH